jgi:predicted oxidoreductase
MFFPYDVSTDITSQVSASIAGSLHNFTTSSSSAQLKQPYLDAIILHAPYPSLSDTLEAYKALESHVPHHITHLGLSNIDLATLCAVYDAAVIKPSLVQNRFTSDIKAIPNPKMPPGIDTPEDQYDKGVRAFCREKGIVWQPWGVLWGSPELLSSGLVGRVAEGLALEREVVLFSFVQGLEEMSSLLVGTGRKERMIGVMDGLNRVEEWKKEGKNGRVLDGCMGEFKGLLVEKS